MALRVIFWSILGAAALHLPLASAGGRSPATIIGESALVDKESGRIFWEAGSSNTLDASVVPILRSLLRIQHFKSTILTSILVFALLRKLVAQGKLLLSPRSNPPFYVAAGLFLLEWTILVTPDFDAWFVIAVAAMYLVESYCSSTRRYLSHAVRSPEQLEDYLENLRNTKPRVEWKVRSFHYEPRMWSILPSKVNATNRSASTIDGKEANSAEISTVRDEPRWWLRKRVTNLVSGSFQFEGCLDKTVVGLRKQCYGNAGNKGLLAKITLSKLLVLASPKTREKYLEQQGNFVAEHCKEDRLAEFSTNIVVPGFRSRLLAKRSDSQTLAGRLMNLSCFWCFTLLGLTVPYRLWLDSQCDEIRVAVQKEISTDPLSVSRSSSWFALGSTPRDDSEFRMLMEELKLYGSSPQNEARDDNDGRRMSEVLQESMESAAESSSVSETDRRGSLGQVEELTENLT